MTEMKKAVAYLRRSTDRQDQSIEDQRKTVEKYAQDREIEVLKCYVDDAISGTCTDDRKAFQEMLRDARADDRKWDLILVYDVKRFGRIDNDEAGFYRFQLRRAGVEVVYIAENFSGDDTDDLLRPVKQWQARQESKDLSRVTIRGLLSLSEGGWWLGGSPPFGYDLLYHDSTGKPYMHVRFKENGDKDIFDPQGRLLRTVVRRQSIATASGDRAKLVLSTPERVEIVKRIYRMYLGGMGFAAIAATLNAEGVPSPRTREWARIHDGKWSTESIRNILTNRIYAGDMVWNRRAEGRFHRIAAKHATPRSSVSAGQLAENPECDWIIVEEAHEALIDRATFLEAQRIRVGRDHGRGGNGFSRGKAKRSTYLLSGLVQCGRCGRNLQGHVVCKSKRRNDGTRVRTLYYMCGGYKSKGPAVCEKALFSQQPLDTLVLELVQQEINRLLSDEGKGVIRRLIDEQLKRSGDDPREEIGRLKERLAELDAQADRLLDLLDDSNRDFVNGKLSKLKNEKELVKAQLDDLSKKKVDIVEPDALADGILGYIESFREVLESGTPEQRKTFLRAFVSRVELNPDRGDGTVQLWDVPEPVGGNLSFLTVAGARFGTG
jgi:site-specific DNA recombinase